jgi:tetratricopeptide (TPR) repeat protein
MHKDGNMGRTLNLLDHLLVESRRLLSIDQPRKALALLQRLARLTDIPLSPAAEGQRLLGETYLKLSQYRSARRHFRRAIAWQPENAAAHHLLARAIVSDPAVDGARAAKPFRRALELDPGNVQLHCDAGVYFGEMGRWGDALALLERAVELAPEDLSVLRALVDAMCEAERFEEARRTVDVARFRFRGVGRLGQLRDNVEFRRSQQSQATGEGADVLPFLRVVGGEGESVRGKKLRRDRASKAHPHLPRVIRHFDTRRGG